MRGLVLELRDGLAAVLLEDGQVVTTDMACHVGETVELPAEVVPFDAGEKKRSRGRWIKGLVAAVLALAVAGGGYAYTSAYACSYVSVDAADASIELAINRRGQVIDVRAVDEGSVILAQELLGDLDRMPVEEALEWTMTTLDRHGLLEDSQGPVIIGVTADNEKREADLNEAAEHFARTPGLTDVVTLEVTPAQRQEAAQRQQSGGRYAYENQKPPGTEIRPGSMPGEAQPDTPQADTAPAEPEETGPAAPQTEEQGQPVETAPAEDQTGNQSGTRPSASRPQNTGGAAAPAQPGGGQGTPQDTGGGQGQPAENPGGEAAPPDQYKDPAQGGSPSQEGQEQPGGGEPAPTAPDPGGSGQQPGGGEPAPTAPDPGGSGQQPGGGEPAPAAPNPGGGGQQPGGGAPQPAPAGPEQ